MPSAADHHAKYLANRRFLDTGDGGSPLSTQEPCWAATVAFYSALHLVGELAAFQGFNHISHGARGNFVSSQHPTIYRSYGELENASRLARYYSLTQFHRQYRTDHVQKVLIDWHLAKIEVYVQPLRPSAPDPGTAGS